MVFDWMYATSAVLAMVLITLGIASLCFSAAAIAEGRWWGKVLGALYILLIVFLIGGFAGGAA